MRPGGVVGAAHTVDMTALLQPLGALVADLNIEGAFIQGDSLCLLQRGNGRSAINARIDLSWPGTRRWLCEAGPAPAPSRVWRFELGALAGVPLSFTDGAALPGGEWVFSAAAEDTQDTYADGPCAGSVIGVVEAHGAIRTSQPLSLRCKVEGIAATGVGGAIELLMVTDADDRREPALLLGATLQR